MTAELTGFEYTDLTSEDALRIFILEPGIGDETIRCSLKEVSFEDAICQYEAISYVWGAADNITTIVVDGDSFKVTVNLAQALRRFRFQQIPRPLWADSICINQKNHAEKSHQVLNMGRVYQNAERVLCWLGTDEQGIAGACFDSIRMANQLIKLRWRDSWGFDNLTHDLKLPELASGDIDWHHFRHLMELPWFGRLW